MSARIPRTQRSARPTSGRRRSSARRSSRSARSRTPAADGAPIRACVQTQRQMPVFTQKAPDYDVLIAADESEVFAGYLPYRTWDPRPVAGSAGLMPTSWDASHELWGARAIAEPFPAHGPSRHDRARQPGLGRDADDRRRGQPRRSPPTRRPRATLMLSPDSEVADFKGVEADPEALEPPAPPADPADRRARHGLRLAAGRLPASGVRARHARPRPAGDQMQAQLSPARVARRAILLAPPVAKRSSASRRFRAAIAGR